MLVSNSSSKGEMYGRLTDIAEEEGGAGRAWTKGAAAQKGHASKRSPRSTPMNLRTHLSRSNGYRLLGMYDESILILEDIKLVKSYNGNGANC